VSKKRLQRGVAGVENVYTQHTPLLAQTLEGLLKGTLSESLHPFLGPAPQTRKSPVEVIVVMLGGATYEEARRAPAAPPPRRQHASSARRFLRTSIPSSHPCWAAQARYVAEMNAANPGVRVLLGGTTMHNCRSFLGELERMGASPAVPPPPPATASPMAAMGGPSGKQIAALTSSTMASMKAGVTSAMAAISDDPAASGKRR
jgi:hypothetical protein